MGALRRPFGGDHSAKMSELHAARGAGGLFGVGRGLGIIAGVERLAGAFNGLNGGGIIRRNLPLRDGAIQQTGFGVAQRVIGQAQIMVTNGCFGDVQVGGGAGILRQHARGGPVMMAVHGSWGRLDLGG